MKYLVRFRSNSVKFRYDYIILIKFSILYFLISLLFIKKNKFFIYFFPINDNIKEYTLLNQFKDSVNF